MSNRKETKMNLLAFSGNLKNVMNERGLTQAELARRTKIAETTVSRWLSGKRMPTIKHLIVLSDFFEVPIDELLADKIIF